MATTHQARPQDLRHRRKLIAVLYADMVGYSRLIGLDDVGTLERLKTLRQNLIDPAITEHGGRIVQTGGDSLLVVFDSIDGAVRCAVKVQQQVPTHDGEQPADRVIRFRIGINIGDAIADETDLHGNAVNVAQRLQTVSPPGGICVSRSVRDHVHGSLGLAFDELGLLNLKNIIRPIEAFALRTEAIDEFGSIERPLMDHPPDALPLPDKPSIAVLPFQNMSADPEQEYFADGVVEEIITALSRIRWLFVIARNSSFTYKGKPIDVKQVGRELGVRYVLEGSVRKVADRVRITVQLLEAETGAHLWADRFNGSLVDVFEFQDEVAISVAGAIEPRMEAAEIHRSTKRPTNSLTAYDYYLRAIPSSSAYEKDVAIRALGLLRRAIEYDPRYGAALALAAWWRLQLDTNGWTDDKAVNRDEAIDLARRALQVADDDPTVLADVAGVLEHFGGDLDASIKLVERALELNPSCVIAWHWSAWLRLSASDPDLAIEHFGKSLRLDPRAQGLRPFYLTGLGIAHFRRREFEKACPLLLASLQQLPSFVTTYRYLAATYAHLGRLSEARGILERLCAFNPAVVPIHDNIRNPEHRELFLSGLRLAIGKDT